MSIDVKRRYAAAAFAVLLALSVFWPSPIVGVNRLCCDAPLEIDELSFLGREAPAWDVLFWFLTGLFVLAILQSGDYEWRDFGAPWRIVRDMRIRIGRSAVLFLSGSAVAVAITWLFVDKAAIALAERWQSDFTEGAIRILNRLGGGMNPALIVGFFLIAGVAYRSREWVGWATAMALAGLTAGLGAQILKALVGRTRPELWLGPFHHARASASSFPSGHTVGAFALAGVLIFGSRSISIRIVAALLATAIGLSRVLAFRHWMSDVVASAGIGLLTALVFVHSVVSVTIAEEPAHSPGDEA